MRVQTKACTLTRGDMLLHGWACGMGIETPMLTVRHLQEGMLAKRGIIV